MSGDFKRGALIYWKQFEFADGGKSDKLLIILGAKSGKDIIAALTTSQQHNRKCEHGCHGHGEYFCVLANKAGNFPKNTWFELYRPVEISSAELVKHGLAKEIWVVRNLPDDLTNAIRNCFKQSQDISQRQIDLLE